MNKLPVNRSDFGLDLQIQLEKRYGLDLRSLALLRLGLAIALLALVANHLQSGPVYSNAAATPLLLEGSLRFWTSGLPTAVPWIHGGLLGLTAIAALFLLLGYRTRWAAIAAWLLVSLLPVQSAAAEFSSERLLPAVLFWAMFLPLGASYAIDSALNLRQSALPNQLFTAATLALRVRQSLVYGFLIFTLLSAEATASPLVVLYFGALLLLWTPVRTTFCRTLAVILGLLGTVLFFPAAFWLEGAVWLAFLPTAIWQSWAERCYGPPQAGLQIYYDADCGFCKKVVHLLRTLLLLLPHTPLLTAQSEASICADMEAQNSWVVVDWQGKRHFKFEAIAYIVSLSPAFRFLAPLLRWSPLMRVGTRFYETIANNRKAAGRFTKPFKFQSFAAKPATWLELIAWGLLAVCAIANYFKLMADAALLSSGSAF